MKNSLKFFVLAVALCSSVIACAQDAKGTAEKVYAQLMRYAKAKNVNGVAKMLDESYVMTGADGTTIDRAGFIAEMTEMCKIVQDASGSITVEKASQYGDEIIIWASMKMKMKMKQNGKVSTLEVAEKFVETMKKTPDGWKFTSSIVIPE